MFPNLLLDKARRIVDACAQQNLRIATAESCTGGLVIGCLTEIAGSSVAIDRSYVVYDNQAKHQMLGVSEASLDSFGAVSPEVAGEMVQGVLAHCAADIAVSITGIAGPGGATQSKPVGLVYFGCLRRGGEIIVQKQIFAGDRYAVRLASVENALDMILARLSEP